METYTFGDCTVIKLEEWFGLRRTMSNQTLDQWLQTAVELSEFERTMLEHLRQNYTYPHCHSHTNLLMRGHSWMVKRP